MATRVVLRIISNIQHTSMVLTGFFMLKRAGLIDVVTELCFDKADQYPHACLVEAEIEGMRVAFDLLDGYNFNIEAMEHYLGSIDFYFKRSFSNEKNKIFTPENRKKILPLGFNFYITFPGNPIDRQRGLKSLASDAIKYILKKESRANMYREVFEKQADFVEANPKILLLCRLWDPADLEVSDRIDLKEERDAINRMRIALIRELGEHYPREFTGGIQNSPYARQVCPDLIAPTYLTNKRNYLDRMKQSDICIATTGLHGSVGWKTAEYIAASRAILSERFRYETVGDFTEGEHYIAYDSTEECLAGVEFLIKNPEVIYRMKQANEAYYNTYLRPDRQVWHALERMKLF